MPGHVTTKQVELPHPRRGYRFHVFVSEHNRGVRELVEELDVDGQLLKTELPHGAPCRLWALRCRALSAACMATCPC